MSNANAQVGIGTTDPDASAALELKATDKGFLPPRMTENDKTTIAAPIPAGLQIFCTDCGCGEMQVYDGTEWLTMAASSGVVPDAPTITSATNAAGPGTVDIAFTAPANNGYAITSYTATSSPDGITGTVSQAGSGTITVSGLDCETAYTFTVTATNCAGTSEASAPDTVTTDLDVGCFQDGGIVFYIASPPADLNGDTTDDRGLVVGRNDLSEAITWRAGSTSMVTGATATAIGKGQTNTTTIVNAQGGGSSAAQICDDHSETVGGVIYNDWFLPSSDEMEALGNVTTSILEDAMLANGGTRFNDLNFYWTSTEIDQNNALRAHAAGTNFEESDEKSRSYTVRAIRAFQ